MDILELLEPSTALSQAGKKKEALAELEKLWQKLLASNKTSGDSFLLVLMASMIARKINDLDLAWKWALRGLRYSGSYSLIGESEFLCGEIAYERGDFETAKKYFQLVKENSGMFMFKERDPKYRKLVE